MKHLFFVSALLVVLILYSSLNYEKFEEKLSNYSEAGDNLSIKLLNEFLKTEEMEEDCKKIRKICKHKKAGPNCSHDGLGYFFPCTKQGYHAYIKDIKNGKLMFSDVPFINVPLNKRLDGSFNINNKSYNLTLNRDNEDEGQKTNKKNN